MEGYPCGVDAGVDNPELLLDEWLGELENLGAGLDSSGGNEDATSMLRPFSHELSSPRIDSYRFSMANLEDSQDVDLDAILGELCALETSYDEEIGRTSMISQMSNRSSTTSSADNRQSCTGSESVASFNRNHPPFRNRDGTTSLAQIRTDSPDNDSAFSDTVSMLSSESSASSGASAAHKSLFLQQSKDSPTQAKAEKIRLALEKMKEANIKKLFIKAFSVDGSSKSLLVDEKMTCGHVARLLADKNHVAMEPKWAVVEHLPHLYMERIYEDHELLVDNLMMWTRDSKNKILFMERPDKISLFQTPERYLICDNESGSFEHDEHSRTVLIDEFFNQRAGSKSSLPSETVTNSKITGHNVPPLEGPLYLKSDSKKGWKKYNFVMRSSGLYYYPKDRVKNLKDLVCLATFDINEIYLGLNWKKKYKSPTDYCFAIKHPKLQQPKSVKYIKFLCAEDGKSLEKWIVAMRIAKHGRQLLENYHTLVDDLAQEDLDQLAHARSCSVTLISKNNLGTVSLQSSVNSPDNQPIYSAESISSASSGRHSRASSSSSSGCMSDGPSGSEGNAFDSEFPMGTIKRKPSMKPNLPLTLMTRQLKEMADLSCNSTFSVNSSSDHSSNGSINSEGYTNTGTLTRRHSRRKSNQSNVTDDGSNSGTLKRHTHKNSKSSIESISSSRSSGRNTPVLSTPIRDTLGTNGKQSPLLITSNSDTALRCSSSNQSNLYSGDLPVTGTLKGYITHQTVVPSNSVQFFKDANTRFDPNQGRPPLNNVINMSHSNESFEEKAKNNIDNNTQKCNDYQIPKVEKDNLTACGVYQMKNNDQFVNNCLQDIEDMPLPPPPQLSPNEADLHYSMASAHKFNPMFSSTASLDMFPPPPLLDPSTLEGYDLSGSQISLMSLPPPPMPVDEALMASQKEYAEVPNIAQQNDSTAKDIPRVNISEIVNQLSSIMNSQQLSNSRDANHSDNTDRVHVNSLYHKQSSSLNNQQAQQIVSQLALQQKGSRHTFNHGRPASSSKLPNQHEEYGTVGNSYDEVNNLTNGSSIGPKSVIYSTCVAELQQKSYQVPNASTPPTATKTLPHTKSVSFVDEIHSPVVLRKQVNFSDEVEMLTTPCSPNKKDKKLSFSLRSPSVGSDTPPMLPSKPLPPERNQLTRLSSSPTPKKLTDSTSNPPKDFLKDLQRVMRKKWQVAQKCKLEPTTTPHEVLGFREYPVLTEDYKETNVSNWVQEHYGHCGVYTPDNLYENIHKQGDNVAHMAGEVASPGQAIDLKMPAMKKRPPPPPPKRSESTQLTTQKLR